MSTPIVPAIIPESREHVIELLQKLSFVHEIQLDLVDGIFDDDISWPYSPKGEPLAIKHATDNFTLEVDLMVANPIPAAAEWVAAGADMLVFHIESVPLDVFKRFAQATSVTVGVSMHGDTSLQTLYAYAEHADYIQLMGIKEIGAQGQPFDDSIIEKIQTLKREFPNKVISVDGSVNKETIVRLQKAGVTRFIVGSAIVKQLDMQAAYTELSALINA